MSTEAQRAELAALLRTRRSQLSRADFGLPPVGRSRTTGMRREEISYLSGVSVTWYTWLEQGRDISPSRQVLDSLARTLRLSAAEHAYVLSLMGWSPSPPSTDMLPLEAPGHVRRLLATLADSPAFAVGDDWRIAAWNDAYQALYPGIASSSPQDRNLLWLIFTDPYVRRLLPSWDDDSRRFLAEFRAQAGARLGSRAVAELLDRLQSASAEFRTLWSEHGIEGFASRERLFHHPAVGDLLLEQHQLSFDDQRELHLIVYTPVEDGTTPGRLGALLSRGATAGP